MEEDTISQTGVYILGITIPLAIIGNILTSIVFQRGPTCKAPQSSLYFKALAVADIYVLLFPGLELFLYDLNAEWKYRDLHAVACKIASFNLYFAVEVSTWITVAVTLDRTLSIYFPLRNVYGNAKKTYIIKLLVVVFFFALCNIYTLVYFDVYTYMYYIEPYSDNITVTERECSTSDDIYGTIRLLDTLNMSIFVFGVPFILNFTCNILLLRKIYKRMPMANSSHLTHAQTIMRRSEANYITYRVKAISTVHLVSTGPFAVSHIYRYIMDMDVSDKYIQVDDVLNVVYYMNSAVNFLLYCATGTDFRRDLVTILKCKRLIHRRGAQVSSENHSNATSV